MNLRATCTSLKTLVEDIDLQSAGNLDENIFYWNFLEMDDKKFNKFVDEVESCKG